MSRKNLFTLVLISILAISSLVACGPTSAPITNGDGNTTTTTTNVTNNFVTVEGNDNHVQIGDNTVTSSENEVVTTEDPAPATEDPAEEEAKVCFYLAWHNGWQNGPERVHTNGELNIVELIGGMSMQAPWSEWTSETEVDGYTVPEGEETNNDAVMGIVCGKTAYMFERTPAAKLPFWGNSFFQLTDQGMLACEDDINTANHGWDGKCDGNQVIVEGILLDDVRVTDFGDDWDALMVTITSWDGTIPSQGTIKEAWTSTIK